MTQEVRFFGLITVAALFLLMSQLLIKRGVQTTGPLTLTTVASIGHIIIQVLTSPIMVFGYALSGVSALLWLLVLSRFDLSYAAPVFSAIYYLLLLLASAVILREDVTPSRWLGASFVIVGIGLITWNR